MKRLMAVIAAFIAVSLIAAVVTFANAAKRAEAVFAKAERTYGTTRPPLPAGFLEALLRVEDPGFEGHSGIDLRTPGAGATTITQGLVKMLYFEHFKPGPFNKLRQSVIALAVVCRIPKERQLTLFLNSVYLGERDGREVHGFADGARTHFSKELAALDERQWLALIAMVVGPNHFDVTAFPQRNGERVARIEAMLAGKCKPRSVLDVYYKGCEGVR